MKEQLKKDVYEANMELVKKGMVIYTWGNVSGIDRETNLVVIKPSRVDYETMSSDTATHLELYKTYPHIGGIVHTHSTYGVVFAQAGMAIPSLGTTHAYYGQGKNEVFY